MNYSTFKKSFAASLILVLALAFAACQTAAVTTETGLIIEDLKIGQGETAEVGDTIEVHYKGMYEDGTVFDSSYDRGETAKFPLGIDYLIQGWEQGIPGMKVGGIRKLIVPPELAYGSEDYSGIPGNSTLYFEIELIGIQ